MAADAGLEKALSKIRPHTSSSLPHQKAPANLLHALETTFRDQNTQASPAAYFAALITTLDSTVQKEKTTALALGDGDMLPAELYLLALVTPHVPPAVIRANLNTFLALTAPFWPQMKSHAPPLRSQLTLYNAVMRASDRSQLELQAVRQSFAFILQLCLDPRPKVRKRAVDLVSDVLSSPPTPLVHHPYEPKVAEWMSNALNEVKSGTFNQKKSKTTSSDPAGTALHLLACLRQVHPHLHPSLLPDILSSSLSLLSLGNPYLTQSVFSVLSDILVGDVEDETSPQRIQQASEILNVLLASAPLKTDSASVQAWLRAIGNAMLAYSSADKDACSAEVLKVWKTVFPFLESENPLVRKEAAGSLASIIHCFSPSMMAAAVDTSETQSTTSVPYQIIGQVTAALGSLAYVSAVIQVFSVICALIIKLQQPTGGRGSPTAAEILMLPLISRIGDMRVKKAFQQKEAADEVLRTAMSAMGPHVLLKALPLNLEPTDRTAGLEPRAFLLPLLTSTHPSPLNHFVSYFVPLTERMFDLQQKADSEGRSSEAKVWSVLISQIWNGLPSYCHAPPDLREALTPQFSQMLSQLLYNQPDLRPSVLRALKVVVESNVAIKNVQEVEMADEQGIPQHEAIMDIEFLSSQAESWLGVFFNVYSSVDRNAQGSVGDVIAAWASIADDKVMHNVCRKVIDLLQKNLASIKEARGNSAEKDSVVATMQNILIFLIPYIPEADAKDLFDMCLNPDILTTKDNGVQKRGYKVLSKLIESGKVPIDAEAVLRRMDEYAENTVVAAKRDRLTLINGLVRQLPSTSLHVIPVLLPEAVLGTKEGSEKARSAAFDLIVAMGQKMAEGGVIKRDLVDDMDEDDAIDVPASVEEYLMMIAGGLAGGTPHLISATITAISRLIFEFNTSIPSEMQADIFATILSFLKSASREIVKSALGFIKLSIHTFPVELLRPHLKDLVPALLGWSHDHKNHFKAKVRHIFERMIRRFGWNDVYAAVGEEEAGKVLINIKKRKERAKRKKSAAAEEGSDEEEDDVAKPATGDAFEDVLYGSESELDDSDEENQQATAGSKSAPQQRKGKGTGARLRLDDDEPMDLLRDAATRVTFGQKGRRKPGQEAAKFKTDEETGKMRIEEDSDADGGADQAAGEDVAGTAYRESLVSADGFTRTPNGGIKFNKDTKKRRRENAGAEEDVEMNDATASGDSKKVKLRSSVKLGHEFKAKNAGGDVKKGGVDPYAYLPLSQAAKKKNGRDRVSVTGKR